MSVDLQTALTAIDLLRGYPGAVMRLYEAFIAKTTGETQATLKQHYQEDIARSDALHRLVQNKMNRT